METFDLQKFEDLSRKNGGRYWVAHDFMLALGYDDWRTFHRVINRAMASCATLGINISEAFGQETIEWEGRGVSSYRLTRFACFLVTMHADSRKPAVAGAKTVLAALADALMEQRMEQDVLERIDDREDLKAGESAMSGAARRAGLQSSEFGIFKDAGFRGMYNRSLKALIQYKGASLPRNRSLYDLMGQTELAANRFRVTQTAERIHGSGATGLSQLKHTAHEVGAEVREFMLRSSGVPPEDLKLEEDINKVKVRLKSAAKEMTRLDSSSGRPARGKKTEGRS